MWLPLKEDFGIPVRGSHYLLPTYKVIDGKLERVEDILQILFVKGDINDPEVERLEGTTHEHLLAMMIFDLKLKDPTPEIDQMIVKLKEALGWAREAQAQKTKSGTQGIYK